MTLRHEPSTRERIVAEAIRLFAERGFRGTTVGEIESAAGLQPRSGGLYKHFASKEELLEAAIERHVSEIEAVRPALEVMPLGDLRAELTLVARWTLAELGAEQQLVKIIQKEGDRFPGLAAQFRERIVERGYEEATKLIGRVMAEAGVEDPNPRALAAIALGSLVNYRIEQTMFGVPPAGIGEEELIETWVELWMMVARAGAAGVAGPHETVRHETAR
jgi:AcrR family transcriptional regulator